MQTTEHEIRIKKCSETCQHKIKFVLTFTKISRNSVEGYWYFIDGTVFLLQYCSITKSLWYEQMILKDYLNLA